MVLGIEDNSRSLNCFPTSGENLRIRDLTSGEDEGIVFL